MSEEFIYEKEVLLQRCKDNEKRLIFLKCETLTDISKITENIKEFEKELENKDDKKLKEKLYMYKDQKAILKNKIKRLEADEYVNNYSKYQLEKEKEYQMNNYYKRLVNKEKE